MDRASDNVRPAWRGSWVVTLVLCLLTSALGDHAWWAIPPLAFAALIVTALMDGRGSITAGWVLACAAVSVAIGAFLKLTDGPWPTTWVVGGMVAFAGGLLAGGVARARQAPDTSSSAAGTLPTPPTATGKW